MARGRPPKSKDLLESQTYLERVSSEVSSNQSKVSMVLGALIILVAAILVFNYFNRSKTELGPAQQTEPQMEEDVSPDKLPGKYTVKEGDTLFSIAEKYYKDGYKYTEIAKTNNLQNPDLIDSGQVLEIPKVESTAVSPSPMDDSEWGPKIAGTTYEVLEGDWLSKIAGRAYGDIYAYDKIVKANNIQNPDLIEPGMVLTIPR